MSGELDLVGTRVDSVWRWRDGPTDPHYDVFWLRIEDYLAGPWRTRRVTNTANNSMCPEVANQGGPLEVVHLAWSEFRTNGELDVFHQVRYLTPVGWFKIKTRVSRWNATGVGCPSMVADGDSVYLVWQDEQAGNYEVYFRSFTPSLPIP
jgi:hypothetical protein